MKILNEHGRIEKVKSSEVSSRLYVFLKTKNLSINIPDDDYIEIHKENLLEDFKFFVKFKHYLPALLFKILMFPILCFRFKIVNIAPFVRKLLEVEE